MDVERFFFAGVDWTVSPCKKSTPTAPSLGAVLRYGTNLGTALQLAQFRDDAASQEWAVAGLGGIDIKRRRKKTK